jgi:hypothetical protein
MTCLQPPPPTVAGILASIEVCAIAYGGPGWASTAYVGLIALLVIVVVLAGLAWLTWRFGR